MGIKEEVPKQIERDQLELEKKTLNNLGKLRSLEEDVAKTIEDLADKLRKVVSELKDYKERQFESSRNYIQMINQSSELITNSELDWIKNHLANLEKTIANETEMYNTLKAIGGTYKDYTKGLKDLEKNWVNLTDDGNNWGKAAAEFSKARGDYVTGKKLEKAEKNLSKYKKNIIKDYQEISRTQSFIQNAYEHLDKGWQKFKMSIKSLQW